jgi:hypothetical protein
VRKFSNLGRQSHCRIPESGAKKENSKTALHKTMRGLFFSGMTGFRGSLQGAGESKVNAALAAEADAGAKLVMCHAACASRSRNRLKSEGMTGKCESGAEDARGRHCRLAHRDAN